MKIRQAALVLGLGIPAIAQDWGTIIFANRNVPHTTEGVTYNIPVWKYFGTGTEGAGDLPGGVTVGLFLPNSIVPLATAVLRTEPGISQHFGNPSSQTVQVTGFAPGSTPTLEVRGWQGPGTYEDAIANNRGFSASYSFTTRPLGGTPAGGGVPITPPGLTGLLLSGSGFFIVPEPSVMAFGMLGIGAMFLRRRK